MKKKKAFDTLQWVRQIRDEAYQEWRRDPIAFRKKEEESVRKFREEYFPNRKLSIR